MNAVAKTPSGTLIAETSTVALITEAEINQQVATAHRFPRAIKQFREDVLALATITEATAEECSYAVPRDGKLIEGPSARFAEIVANAWGNCRAGARVVSEDASFITSQGVFHDLQKNVAIAFEVKRRITNKSGKRFGDDMIAVTGNAASSIALRNAILKGVPAALWRDLWEESKRVARGDFKTLANRRADALKAFQGYGVSPDKVFTFLSVKGAEDITLDHLVTLRGLIVAFKEGDSTPEEVFSPQKTLPTPPQPPAPTDGAGDGSASTVKPPKPPAHDPETGEVTQIGKDEDHVATRAEASSKPQASGADDARSATEASDAPESLNKGHEWGSEDSVLLAYDEGYDACGSGIGARAIPGEYREPGHERELNSWKDGWRAKSIEPTPAESGGA